VQVIRDLDLPTCGVKALTMYGRLYSISLFGRTIEFSPRAITIVSLNEV